MRGGRSAPAPIPARSRSRMFDLTIPTDHDFYVQTATTAVLVHNCGGLIGSLRGAFNETKRLVNVPRAWLNNRALASSLGGVPPEPNATVGDLLDMVPGNPQRAAKLTAGLARSDEDLLNSVFAPDNNPFIATNPSMPNTILQGNHRVYQLLLRAADPENTNITVVMAHRYLATFPTVDLDDAQASTWDGSVWKRWGQSGTS
jgi:hypothetical protein